VALAVDHRVLVGDRDLHAARRVRGGDAPQHERGDQQGGKRPGDEGAYGHEEPWTPNPGVVHTIGERGTLVGATRGRAAITAPTRQLLLLRPARRWPPRGGGRPLRSAPP